jgi:site-specific recombinase XerD
MKRFNFGQLEKILLEFYEYLTGVRAATESTIAAYKHDVNTYCEFLENQPNFSGEFLINEQTIRGFVAFLRKRNNADSTIQRRLDGLNAFWKFLHKYRNFNRPIPIGDCDVRLKNKRNPSRSIPHNDYIIFLQEVDNELRKIK